MLIIFEGFDGAGKSSIIELVKERLENDSRLVSVYHFPGKENGRLGEIVYQIHHKKIDGYELDLPEISLQMLHVAAHIDIEISQIASDLRNNILVILDRSWLSTLAYGCANGIPSGIIEKLVEVEREFLPESKVTKVFFIHRDKSSSEEGKREKVEQFYKKYINKYFKKDQIVYVDNDSNIDDIINVIYMTILGEVR